MADKIRGALSGIDWSKPNQTSINTNRNISHKKQDLKRSSNEPNTPSSQNEVTSLPVNPYPSVIAPVKSGRGDTQPLSKNVNNSSSSQSKKNEADDIHMYLGFLGSIQVSTEKPSTGIDAIQTPMRALYYPYRTKNSLAQERVLCLTPEGVEVFYLPDPNADEPVSYVLAWENILYVEPLKFTTRSSPKDKKLIRAAFEPCETQRLTMLGDREFLFTPLTKEHRHISLLKHPALFCMVVKDPNGYNEYYTHGFVCSTVEESVFIARRIRDELEAVYRLSLTSNKQRTPIEKTLSASTLSLATNGYAIPHHDPSHQDSKDSKLKIKKDKKKKAKGTYTTHTGDEAVDLGTFHFGMSTTNSEQDTFGLITVKDDDENEQNMLNENFAIGRPKLNAETRNTTRNNTFSEFEEPVHQNTTKPVGVVQPQVTSFRDAFKVLPTVEGGDKSKLKPTVLGSKAKIYNEITPELEMKLKKRQSDIEPIFSSLAPRDVVNPLAEQVQMPRKSFLDAPPGPLNRMSANLPFKPSAALPPSAWQESVLSNYKSKEKIENKLESQTVDAKELPKLESDKKEQEMANLFENVDIGSASGLGGHSSSAINDLHDALGFLP